MKKKYIKHRTTRESPGKPLDTLVLNIIDRLIWSKEVKRY